MKSLRGKIILVITILLLVVCTSFGISAYIISSNVLISNVNNELPQMAVQGSYLVEKFVEEQWTSLEVLASNDEIRNPSIPMEQKIKVMKEEAKRAGEAGRGFSVVADEIRKLAEASKGTVIEIHNVTDKVIGAVENLSKGSNRLLNFMNTNVQEDYNNMLTMADNYNRDAEFVNNLVTGFSSTSEELLASINEVSKTIEGVTQATNEGAEGATDIASRVSEINKKSENVSQEALKVKESAEKLKNEISRFKI